MNTYEIIAQKYLIAKGLQVLCCNYSWPGGEVDIIGLDEQELVFIEVKYRSKNLHGDPLEHITPRQQHRIRNTALVYLEKEWSHPEPFIRFDAIGILEKNQNFSLKGLDLWQDYAIDWIKNAF